MDTNRDVRTLRQKLGLSQQQLAERFYVDQSTISDWERNGLPKRGLVIERFDDIQKSAAQEQSEGA